MHVFIATGNHNMGSDGDYTWVISVHKTEAGAQKAIQEEEANQPQSNYEYDYFIEVRKLHEK